MPYLTKKVSLHVEVKVLAASVQHRADFNLYVYYSDLELIPSMAQFCKVDQNPNGALRNMSCSATSFSMGGWVSISLVHYSEVMNVCHLSPIHGIHGIIYF